MVLPNNPLSPITFKNSKKQPLLIVILKSKAGTTHMKWFSSKDLKGFDKIKLVLSVLMRIR